MEKMGSFLPFLYFFQAILCQLKNINYLCNPIEHIQTKDMIRK